MIEEKKFGWRYAILKTTQFKEDIYHVCEEYCGLGYSEAETPQGDTPEELQEELRMMLEDITAAIKHNNIIKEGDPYHNTRELEAVLKEEDTIKE